VVEGTGSAVISDNVIDGAENGGIVGYRWTDPASGDLAAGGGGDFPNLTIGRNRVS
jgi:signal transduction histidine kinase